MYITIMVGGKLLVKGRGTDCQEGHESTNYCNGLHDWADSDKRKRVYQVGPLLFKTNISPGYICLFRLISYSYKMMVDNFSN